MAELVHRDGADPASDASGVRRGTSASRMRVIDALSTRAPRTVGDLAARAGMSVAEVQSELGELEMEGAVAERERGWIARSR
jgi:DNA processing protein